MCLFVAYVNLFFFKHQNHKTDDGNTAESDVPFVSKVRELLGRKRQLRTWCEQLQALCSSSRLLHALLARHEFAFRLFLLFPKQFFCHTLRAEHVFLMLFFWYDNVVTRKQNATKKKRRGNLP